MNVLGFALLLFIGMMSESFAMQKTKVKVPAAVEKESKEVSKKKEETQSNSEEEESEKESKAEKKQKAIKAKQPLKKASPAQKKVAKVLQQDTTRKKNPVKGEEDDSAEEITAKMKATDLNKDISVINCPAVYFSPHIKAVVEKLISDEEKSIEGACYEFTLFDLADLWVKRVMQNKLKSELIVNDVLDFVREKSNGYIKMPYALLWLKLNNIPVSACKLRNTNRQKFGGYGNMHHKFFVFGKNGNTHRPLLITGSFNWTAQADLNNWEDLIILDDPEIIARYLDYYKEMPRKELGLATLLLYKKRQSAENEESLDRSKKMNFVTASAEAKINNLIEKE